MVSDDPRVNEAAAPTRYVDTAELITERLLVAGYTVGWQGTNAVLARDGHCWIGKAGDREASLREAMRMADFDLAPPSHPSYATPMPDAIAQLRAALLATGKTPYAIEQATGVPRMTIGRILSGKADPTVATMDRLAGFVGLQVGLIARVANNPKNANRGG